MALGIADVLGFFSKAAPVPGQATGNTVQQTAAPPPADTNQHVNNNATVPNANTPKSDGTTPGIPKVGEGDQAPLANFKDLWQAPKDAKPATPLTPNLKFDPAKLLEAAKTVDFSTAIPPELREKLKAGNDEQALVLALNQVGQLAYAQAVGATTQITEAALTKQAETLIGEHLPKLIREHMVSAATRQDNPIYSNPAAAPIVSLIESGVAAKFPQATPAEARAHVDAMLNGLAQLIVGSAGGTITPKSTQTQSASRGETNWEKYFTS